MGKEITVADIAQDSGAGVVLLVAAIVPVSLWIYQLNHPSFDLKKFADDLI